VRLYVLARISHKVQLPGCNLSFSPIDECCTAVPETTSGRDG
jgi:hypothetical protein